MRSATAVRCALSAAAVLVTAIALSGYRQHEDPRGTAVLPPEAAPFFQHLLPASELTETLDIQLRGEEAVYRFRQDAAIAEFVLSHPATCDAPEGPLCIRLALAEGPTSDALVERARNVLVTALRAAKDSPPWKFELDPSHRPVDRPVWLWIADGLFVVLLSGVVLALWRTRRQLLSREAVVPALLGVLALALRFIATGGPADIRPILRNIGPQRAAWDALLHLLFAVLPEQDETIWAVNRIVGAASIPLLYAVLRRRFGDPLIAVAGATALAVTPLMVRFSASDTPYTLVVAAFLGAIVAYDRFRDTASNGAFVLALGLLTAAMQLRPDGPWLIVPATLLALAQPPGAHAQLVPRTAPALAGALLFLVINGVPTAWALQGHIEGGNLRQHFVLIGAVIGSPWADPVTTPPALAALVVLGAAIALVHRRAGLLWLVATLVAMPLDAPAAGKFANLPAHRGYAFAVPLGPPVLDQEKTTFHQYANARYHVPAMSLACGLAGIGVAGLLSALAWLRRRRVPGATFVAAAVVCAAALPRFDLLHRMWVPQQEFAFFREHLRQLDPACHVVTMIDVRDAGFVPFEYLAPGRMQDTAAFLAGSEVDGCVVYYRAGNCFTLDVVPAEEWSTFTINPVCRSIEERFQLIPIAEMQVAALPYRGEIYSRDPLPLGFYRLESRSAGSR